MSESAGCCADREELAFRRTPVWLPLQVGLEHLLWVNDDLDTGLLWGVGLGHGVPLSDGTWETLEETPEVTGGPRVRTPGAFARFSFTLIGTP